MGHLRISQSTEPMHVRLNPESVKAITVLKTTDHSPALKGRSVAEIANALILESPSGRAALEQSDSEKHPKPGQKR